MLDEHCFAIYTNESLRKQAKKSIERMDFSSRAYEWNIFSDSKVKTCAFEKQIFYLLFSAIGRLYRLINTITEIKVMNILNNGTIKDIMTLPTIGKKRAELLMAYRIENGGFSSVST